MSKTQLERLKDEAIKAVERVNSYTGCSQEETLEALQEIKDEVDDRMELIRDAIDDDEEE